MEQVGKGKEPEDLPALRAQMLAWLDKWVGQVQASDDRGALQFVTQLLQQVASPTSTPCLSRQPRDKERGIAKHGVVCHGGVGRLGSCNSHRRRRLERILKEGSAMFGASKRFGLGGLLLRT